MKNIEKIRNMSAEELAELIDNPKCDHCVYGEYDMDCDVCDEGIVKWLEQEAEKPTNAELIQAAELLKANCKNQKNCNKCIFLSKVCCKFEYKTPEEWKLLHRKTRKEVLFEKFPNAQTTCEGRPLICARRILGDKVECINKCEDCWNVPAESEVQDEID